MTIQIASLRTLILNLIDIVRDRLHIHVHSQIHTYFNASTQAFKRITKQHTLVVTLVTLELAYNYLCVMSPGSALFFFHHTPSVYSSNNKI